MGLTIEILFYATLGYLLGSIPFGLLLTKWATGEDIRASGSGNIGATNVLRSGKKGLAALTLLLDGAKAWLAVYLAMQFTEMRDNLNLGESYPSYAALAAGLAALLGHVFPVWLKFKGGKGVASYFGMVLGLCMPVFWIAAAIWLSTFLLKRISSMAALMTIFFIPGWMYIFNDGISALTVGIASVVIAWRHKENIARLRKGEEKPFTFGSDKGEAA